MPVGVPYCIFGEIHFGQDPSCHALVVENATVGKKCESPGLGIEHHPTPCGFLIFHAGGHGTSPLILFPHFGVPEDGSGDLRMARPR